MAPWETVIGLECHVELDTQTKMFCGCRNVFGADPNTNTCPVCMGHPGSLPVPNAEAIRRIVKIGLALESAIAPHSLFHRKNYFYPDLPKNYQISQYDLPICVGGHLDIDLGAGSTKRVGITRVHMEEDTGKTTHGSESGRIHEAAYALIDYNRAGVPLVECVSEPDMRTPDEAAAYLRELRATLEVLDVSDVKMEEGSLRCDANISIRPSGSEVLGTKVEIKNMNSIRSLEHALLYEEQRQIHALEAGEHLVQETRHWDEGSGMTTSMRSKEEAFDYRYFPEPDIPPLEPSEGWIDEIRATLPELPRARAARATKRWASVPRWSGCWSPTGPPSCSSKERSPPERTAPSRRATSPTSSAWLPTAPSPGPARRSRSRTRSRPALRSRSSSTGCSSGRSPMRAPWEPSRMK